MNIQVPKNDNKPSWLLENFSPIKPSFMGESRMREGPNERKLGQAIRIHYS